MTIILLVAVLVLQLISLSIFFLKKSPSLDLLKKDIIILERNMEIMRAQMVLIITKSNLDANRISYLESISSKSNKPNKSDTNFH